MAEKSNEIHRRGLLNAGFGFTGGVLAMHVYEKFSSPKNEQKTLTPTQEQQNIMVGEMAEKLGMLATSLSALLDTALAEGDGYKLTISGSQSTKYYGIISKKNGQVHFQVLERLQA